MRLIDLRLVEMGSWLSLTQLWLWLLFRWVLRPWLRGRRQRSPRRGIENPEVVVQGPVVGTFRESSRRVIVVRPLSSTLLGGSRLPFPAPDVWLVAWRPRRDDVFCSGDWVRVIGVATKRSGWIEASNIHLLSGRQPRRPPAPPQSYRGDPPPGGRPPAPALGPRRPLPGDGEFVSAGAIEEESWMN